MLCECNDKMVYYILIQFKFFLECTPFLFIIKNDNFII